MKWLRIIRFQTSLRSTLVMFVLTCCIFAYLAYLKKKQLEVYDSIRELGGDLHNVDFQNGRSILPSRSVFIPNIFYKFLPECYNYVYVTSPEVDDDKLRQILQLPGIEGLNISSSRISEKGLIMLLEKPRLKEILLYDGETVAKESILRLEAAQKGNCTIKH